MFFESFFNFFHAPTNKDLVVIFLDIDGVLFEINNSDKVERHLQESFLAKNEPIPEILTREMFISATVNLFNERALNNLKTLIESIKATGKKPAIVLSSNWRMLGDLTYLKIIFGQHFFADYIIDKTVHFDLNLPEQNAKVIDIVGNRSLEIQYWLDANKAKIADFLILDDNDFDFSDNFNDNFIYCQNLFADNELQKALNLINPDQSQELSYDYPLIF